MAEHAPEHTSLDALGWLPGAHIHGVWFPAMANISAPEALRRLREGNQRFVSGLRSLETLMSHLRRREFVLHQAPFAVVLGCSDSRVPVEMVFDQGLGDLFVIRTAGEVLDDAVLGSIEYGILEIGIPLIVVLGHQRCGAIDATLDELQQPSERQSRNLASIVGRIRPSVESLLATELRRDPAALAREAVRANVRVSTSALRHGSQVLERLIERDGLLVVGAEYALETGAVEFLEAIPD